jgi:L-fuconolactonase
VDNPPIIDAHVHLWDTRRLNYPWLQKQPSLARPFVLADLDAAVRGCGIESVVVVEAACEPDQAVDEVRWLHELADGASKIAAIVASAPLERGDAVEPILKEHARYPLVRGIRREIVGEGPGFCVRPDFLRGLELIAERGWSFDIVVRPEQLADAGLMVERSPRVQFVLDHIGSPDIAGGKLEPWKSSLRRLSQQPNVWCKLSGVITRARPGWTAEDLGPYLKHVLDCFGPERVMFASDWPVITRAGRIEDWLAALRRLLAGHGETEQELMMRRNAARFYGIVEDETDNDRN